MKYFFFNIILHLIYCLNCFSVEKDLFQVSKTKELHRNFVDYDIAETLLKLEIPTQIKQRKKLVKNRQPISTLEQSCSQLESMPMLIRALDWENSLPSIRILISKTIEESPEHFQTEEKLRKAVEKVRNYREHITDEVAFEWLEHTIKTSTAHTENYHLAHFYRALLIFERRILGEELIEWDAMYRFTNSFPQLHFSLQELNDINKITKKYIDYLRNKYICKYSVGKI